ncbi:MAG: gfo/Idh/MocA family oxidoreductase [Planctomycetota bacterium]|nr:MAG: gfo/Idh/MocA family oxidoreductase [Planctomycetota bacterium]
MSKRNRRQFLEDSMFAAAAAVAAGSANQVFAAEEKQSKSPNEKLGVAVVGCGGRGGSHLGAFSTRDDTEVLYVVDVDDNHAKQRASFVKSKQGREPKMATDMREAFDDKSVDIVTTATPNHWHSLVSIWAIQAGKDVYVEKPVSHNVSEGRRVVEAARKYNKMCQTGTQSRSNPGMREAMQYIHDGKIGKVKVSRGLCYKRRPTIGALGEYPIPPGVDYDLWLGPAQYAPLTRPRFHYDWHWQFPYGNGDLGNQGIHQMDLCRWALGADQVSDWVLSYGGRLGYEDAGDTANTQMVIHGFGDQALVFEVRGLVTDSYKGANVGIIVEGTDGYVVMTSYNSGAAFDPDGNKVKEFSGGADHYGNFVDAVRSRDYKDLNADIEEGHLSSALCHLGNISYQLGEQLPIPAVRERLQGLETPEPVLETYKRFTDHLEHNKIDLEKTTLAWGPNLAIDPKKETFIGNDKANAKLTRDYRKPYVVPPAGQV